SSLPIQGNSAFRLIQNGAAKVEITAEPTLPSAGYRSVATPLVGVAVANVYSSPLPVTVTVYDRSGQSLGQGSMTIPATGHTSFNLFQVIPSLPASFTGSLLITPRFPDFLIAWAVYADSSGIISSLPDGRAGFPVSHWDEIPAVFDRVVAAYQATLPDFGAAPQLVRSPQNDGNA